MQTSVTGFPRIGSLRELKFATEKYFTGEIADSELFKIAGEIRKSQWSKQKSCGIDFIPSNDFSFYDNILDTAVMLNIIPERYRALGLSELDTYFAMARGYQGKNGDVKALAMKKWFNTNYHYMVPEIENSTKIILRPAKPVNEYLEARDAGIKTKPVIIGPFTMLKLCKFTEGKHEADYKTDFTAAYIDLICMLGRAGAEWVQLDEPWLVRDLTDNDISLFKEIYGGIIEKKGTVKLLLQTYFGDIRDCYDDVSSMGFDGLGLDFIEGRETASLISFHGIPDGMVLFAGLVNGKNIWRNNYAQTLKTLRHLKIQNIKTVISTSCSMLHVPYTVENESSLPDDVKCHFSFAWEKLSELQELGSLSEAVNYLESDNFKANALLFSGKRSGTDEAVRARVNAVTESDFTRTPAFAEREAIQKERFRLPLLPTTTIGSFPQTADVKAARKSLRCGEISEAEYTEFIRGKIVRCIAVQEEIGLDVLVHGEYERNDMVEYFGEHLKGYIFTEKAWVQSYGTRCVKPPVIWGDISRSGPITVGWSIYAQSLTDKPVKGMLTGPVTIFNWSFPREDISPRESVYQIALAIRDEVMDLEKSGIGIIQIDEAALREKLPLRKSDWHSEYLDWAIKAFRLVHSGTKPETQIHTHMCYSEFIDIIPEIDSMDADVITFEASRSDLTILDSLQKNNFKTEVGPGVYDIHSPRVPSVGEIKEAIQKMLAKLSPEKLWINPDCGLKTRGEAETEPSLKNLVSAARDLRETL